MSNIALIIFGLIVGEITEIFMFGHALIGFIITILVGIASILMGMYIGRELGLFRRPRRRQGGRGYSHSLHRRSQLLHRGTNAFLSPSLDQFTRGSDLEY